MSDRLTSELPVEDGLVKDELKIASIPLDIRWADVAYNLEEAGRVIRSLDSDTDVAVLPELFTTAFISDPALMAVKAEEGEGVTLASVKALAAETGIAIAGSYLCVENGEYLNRGFFVTPEGETAFYDKRHLFCLSPESKLCRRGETDMAVVNYKGWNIGVIICYDLRFPAFCRNRGQRYDVLLVPANWPQVRAYAWHHLLIARAIENQAIVVGADRAGTDEYGTYDGMTEIYDAMGKPVGVHTTSVDAVYATQSLSRLRKMRGALPFGKDADDFAINY